MSCLIDFLYFSQTSKVCNVVQRNNESTVMVIRPLRLGAHFVVSNKVSATDISQQTKFLNCLPKSSFPTNDTVLSF